MPFRPCALRPAATTAAAQVAALASGAKHVPFRNSKLTHLMQNALSGSLKTLPRRHSSPVDQPRVPRRVGSSKTLMFVNISPLAKHYNESVSSLRFAQKVNGCLSSNKRGLPGK